MTRPRHIVGRKGSLTPEAVRAIRAAEDMRRSFTREAIARRFGVSPGHVSDILRGRAYKWVR